MSFSVTTAATKKPLSLDEVKAHLNLTTDFTDDDELLDSMIDSTIDYIENYLRRSLLTQTITAKYDFFPHCFELERPPLQSITSIQYIDTAGDTQTYSSANYTVDTTSEPARVVEAYGTSWPTTRNIINAVTVTYVAGYTSAGNVPTQIKQAMKILIGDWYKERESFIVGVMVSKLPHTARMLLQPYRVSI